MTGVPGINSVLLAKAGCQIVLVDTEEERLIAVSELWDKLGLSSGVSFELTENLGVLPFDDNSFDLVWNFASLWHINDTDNLVKEMARISRNLVFISIPNRFQIGYVFRKYIIDREFFEGVYEKWASIDVIKQILSRNGLRLIEEGVFDIPPWPDTALPIGTLLERLGLRRNKTRMTNQNGTWRWNIMDYYMGIDADLPRKIERFTFLERLPLPLRMKSLWGHHRYVVGESKSLE
jgi:SAM-dependent methyltransferase